MYRFRELESDSSFQSESFTFIIKQNYMGSKSAEDFAVTLRRVRCGEDGIEKKLMYK